MTSYVRLRARLASDAEFASDFHRRKAALQRASYASNLWHREYVARCGLWRRQLRKLCSLRPLGLPPMSAAGGPAHRIKLPKVRHLLTDAERALRRRLKNQRKWAKRKGARGRVTPADIEWLRTSQKGRCFYCCRKLGEKYHIDHFVAIARGGSNERQNLRLACPACNIAKSDKPAHEFLGLMLT